MDKQTSSQEIDRNTYNTLDVPACQHDDPRIGTCVEWYRLGLTDRNTEFLTETH